MKCTAVESEQLSTVMIHSTKHSARPSTVIMLLFSCTKHQRLPSTPQQTFHWEPISLSTTPALRHRQVKGLSVFRCEVLFSKIMKKKTVLAGYTSLVLDCQILCKLKEANHIWWAQNPLTMILALFVIWLLFLRQVWTFIYFLSVDRSTAPCPQFWFPKSSAHFLQFCDKLNLNWYENSYNLVFILLGVTTHELATEWSPASLPNTASSTKYMLHSTWWGLHSTHCMHHSNFLKCKGFLNSGTCMALRDLIKELWPVNV